jgi:hypothetical protein
MASKPMSEERLAEQRSIVMKATNGKMLKKYSGVMLMGENANILRAIMGELRNTHLAVFKNCLGKKSCEHCGLEKRLARAHTKSRPQIAKEVLDSIHPDPSVAIDMEVFVKAFVMRHIDVGVWMLCATCHKELG